MSRDNRSGSLWVPKSEVRKVSVQVTFPHLVNMGNELLWAAEIQRAEGTHVAASVIRPFFALLGNIGQC